MLNTSNIQIVGTLSRGHTGEPQPPVTPLPWPNSREAGYFWAQIPIRFCSCAVLSNCCDLEPRNGRLAPGYINLARLREIPNAIRDDPSRFASLQANRDPRDPISPGYIDFFYLAAHASLEGVDWRVHFNQITSIATSEVEMLLSNKLLQLDDRSRMRFKIKLAFTNGRTNADEVGLENPWSQEAAP